MNGLARPGRAVVLGGAAIMVAGIVLFAIDRGWIQLGAVVSVCGLILSAAGLYLSRHPAPAGIPRLQQREYAAERLGEAVRLQWEDEVKVRGLADPAPMPVQWKLTGTDIADHPRLVFRGRSGFEGASDRIDELIDQFLALRRQRLVILGEPGSGKTTLAMQLVLQLLQVRAPTDPVPVLLDAASWNTATSPRMQDWLIRRLNEVYPALRAIDKSIAEQLVAGHMVLPVIDGLDEVDPGQRGRLLTSLNSSLGTTDPVVLTCRTDEYIDTVDTADVLTAAAVIEAHPLTARDAAHYLDDCLPARRSSEWNLVLEHLRQAEKTPLAEVCATPLGLWLVRTIYVENKTALAPLIDSTRFPDVRSLSNHLFDELIPAVCTRQQNKYDSIESLSPHRIRDAESTRQWLAHLAVELHGDRDLRWWRIPNGVSFAVTILLTWLVLGVVSMVPYGLTYGLMSAIDGIRTIGKDELAYDYPSVRIDASFVLGAWPMLWGMTLLGAIPIAGRIRQDPRPGFVNLHLRRRGRRLTRSLITGLVVGSVVGVALTVLPTAGNVVLSWMKGQPMDDVDATLSLALFIGLSMGSPIGTVVGFARWARSPGVADPSRTPLSTYRDSRNLTALLVAALGLVGWLAVGLLGVFVGYWRGWEDMLQMMLAYGLLGLVLGAMIGLILEISCFGFVVRTWWLALTGKLPWHVMSFLDDAYRLGLLRASGVAYQFRHAALQDHLASSTA
ncbi:NACHT domain-containing protein [Nocardia asteroides]